MNFSHGSYEERIEQIKWIRAAFGIIDRAPAVHLFSLSSPLLLAVAAAIITVSLVASVQPLVRNTMRNPIRDIRDE